MISKHFELKSILVALAWVVLPAVGFAKVKVVTSTTDLAYVMKQIGGELVTVDSLLDGTENPHYVDAVPSFIQLAANADIVCVVGLELEVGWMPKVLSKSGNATVQPGGQGYCEAAAGIAVLEKPVGAVDRSLGDVHPGGNPHFWLDPIAVADASEAMVEVLINADPGNSDKYIEQQSAFRKRMVALKEEIKAKLDPVLKNFKKPHLAQYHSEFSYFLGVYGLVSMGTIEEKPGVKPAAGRLAKMALEMKRSSARFVLAAPYNPESTLTRFTELSGAPVFVAPTSLRFDSDFDTIEKLQHKLADGVIEHLAGRKIARP